MPLASHETVRLPGRLANALYSYLAYAVQMVLPLNLSVLYRYHENGFSPVAVGATVLFLVAATALAFAGARRAPYLLVGWLWYLTTALPVIGIVQFSLQARADRYTYIPLTGLFLALVWGGAALAGKSRRARIAVGTAAGIVLPLLIGLTFRQVEVWRSSVSLFSNAVREDRGNWQAWNYLGQALWVEGRVQEAVADYREALRLRPDFAEARFNLSFALSKLGQTEEASTLYRESTAADPNFRADLYYQTGLVMLEKGDRAAAVSSLQEALRIKPDFPEAADALKKIFAGGGP
jgi:tetratricopeptide (TPR) repeat protein